MKLTRHRDQRSFKSPSCERADSYAIRAWVKPVFAILHIDVEGLHPHSCTLIAAESQIASAESILADPIRWYPLLAMSYPDEDDPRSLDDLILQARLTPQRWLKLIAQTQGDGDRAETLRIRPLTIAWLENVSGWSRWLPIFAIEDDETDQAN